MYPSDSLLGQTCIYQSRLSTQTTDYIGLQNKIKPRVKVSQAQALTSEDQSKLA